MRRLYFAIFGSGLGHVTRIFELSERLRREDDEFRFSSSAQGAGYLGMVERRVNVLKSPHLDVDWTEEGSFSSKEFLPHFPFTLNSFFKQVAFEAEQIAKFNPRLVVSDSRLSAVLAARARDYPVVTMLNQFMVAFPPRFRMNALGRLYERFAGDVLGLLWSLSDRVLMTDLPPPYTIGVANLEGSDVARIVEFVGFTSSRPRLDEMRLSSARTLLDLDARPIVFFQVSGPEATKGRFVDVVLKSTERLSSDFNLIISIGRVGGSPEPKRLSSGAWLYEWCPIKDELFSLSSLIVARSGHRTIGQCIDGGKPALLVPIHNHSEQIGNATRFCELGLGLRIMPENLSPQVLTESVCRCLSDSSYRNRAEALMSISKRYDGIGRCADVINSYN